MAIFLVHYLRFCHQHQVVLSNLHGPDGLGEAESLAILDVVHLEIEPWGEGCPVSRRRQSRAGSVATMVDSVSEEDQIFVSPSSSNS